VSIHLWGHCTVYRDGRRDSEMKLYLQTEQIVNGADDDVDRGCAACLCAQIVLEI